MRQRIQPGFSHLPLPESVSPSFAIQPAGHHEHSELLSRRTFLFIRSVEYVGENRDAPGLWELCGRMSARLVKACLLMAGRHLPQISAGRISRRT
jgi:hypothetical protein